MKKRVLSFILVFILTAMSFQGITVKADKEQFEVSLSYGYSNKLEMGKDAPFEITVKNNGDNFEGAVQILLSKSNAENVMFEKNLSLSSGQQKTVSMTVDTSGVSGTALIRILNSRDKVIYRHEAKLNFAKDACAVNIGVLTDDFSALSYASGKSLQSESVLITTLYELNADSLQANAAALEMLDVILISDYSTDNLSDKQLEAIMTWVNNGGLLLVGTGSTASKTLSKLNRGYIDVKTGILKKYNTKYGVSMMSFAYDYLSDYYLMTHQYGKEYAYIFEATTLQDYSEEVAAGDYDAFFYKFYGLNSDLLRELFWRNYFGDTYEWFLKYYDSDELRKVEEDFADFCYNEILREYYEDIILAEAKQETSQMAEELKYVSADILEVSMEGAISEFQGEIEGSEDKVKLVEVLQKGYGYVAVAGFDFTKNPFASYTKGNTLVFTDIVESLIVGKLYQDMQEFENNRYYYYGYDYNVVELGDKIAALDAPPLVLYVVLIIGYIVAGMVLYAVLKKKNKSLLLWPAQAILALAMALVVFLAGFTTRITTPQLNVARINLLENNICNETNIVTATIPGTKSVEFGFVEDYAFEYLSEAGYRYYYSSSSEISEDYVIGYLDKTDMTGIEIANRMAMDTSYMQLSKVNEEVGDVVIDASYLGGILSGTITNNYGANLENAYIYTGLYVYYIGDIKQGETIDLSTVKRETFSWGWYNWSEMSEMIFPDAKASVSILFFGSNNKEFKEHYNRRALANYCFNEYFESQIYNYSYTTSSGSGGMSVAIMPDGKYVSSSTAAGAVAQNAVNKIGFMAFPVYEEAKTVQAVQEHDETVTEIVVKVVDNVFDGSMDKTE